MDVDLFEGFFEAAQRLYKEIKENERKIPQYVVLVEPKD